MELKGDLAESQKGRPFRLPDAMAEHQRFLSRMLSFPNVMELAWKTRVGTTPCDVVFNKRKLTLLFRETRVSILSGRAHCEGFRLTLDKSDYR